MAGPRTLFDADECQALVDVYSKLLLLDPNNQVEMTTEELAVIIKLKTAGKLYLPNNLKAN